MQKRTFQAFFSILVIDFSFPLVTEHFVSLSYLLELLLSPRGLVLVRVVLEGHFSVGLLDVILVGSPSQAKDLVVVFAHLHLKLVSDHWESGITKNNYMRLVERKGQSIALDGDTLTKRRGTTFCWKNFLYAKILFATFFSSKTRVREIADPLKSWNFPPPPTFHQKLPLSEIVFFSSSFESEFSSRCGFRFHRFFCDALAPSAAAPAILISMPFYSADDVTTNKS